MQLFVKWDFAESKIVKGPQAVRGAGDDWFPFVAVQEVLNPRTQTARITFDPECQTVFQTVHGDPAPTYQQARSGQYPSLREQLDALWHDIHNGCLDKTGQFYNRIAEVKNSNPRS